MEEKKEEEGLEWEREGREKKEKEGQRRNGKRRREGEPHLAVVKLFKMS